MSDTRKTPIHTGNPGPISSHLRPEPATGTPVGGVDEREGMFDKHTPLMPDDPHWSAARPRPEGSRVAPSVSSPAMPSPPSVDRNQGEGDRVASRRYNDAAEQHVADGKVEPAARAAKNSLDGAFAGKMAESEAVGRAPAEVGLRDRARGIVNRARHTLEQIWHGTKPS